MQKPHLPVGAGLGLRSIHHAEFARSRPKVAWVEVHSENFMGGGANLAYLENIRKDYSVSLHGVGLSLGSSEGIDPVHLERLASLVECIEPDAVSDHVSWSVNRGYYYNDLLPLPYTNEALNVMAENITRIQDRLQRNILIENPSTYLQYKYNDMDETDFIASLCQRTGCFFLFDINNIVVNSFNHGFDPKGYIDRMSGLPIGEFHLAGHHTRQLGNRGIKIDDHGSAVPNEVWALFAYALEQTGPAPVLIERDSVLPPLGELLDEVKQAQLYLDAA